MGAWLVRTATGIFTLLVGVTMALANDAGMPVSADLGHDPHAEAARDAQPASRPLRHGVFRFTSYPAAWTAAQKTNRPILVYATAPSCHYCVRMLGETYQSKLVKGSVNDSFETVYVDRAEQPDLASKLNIRLFPSTIIVAPNNEVIDVIEGYVDAETLHRRLKTAFVAAQPPTPKR